MKKSLFLLFCIFFLILFACSPQYAPTFSENTQISSTEYNLPLETPDIIEKPLDTLSEPIESIIETVLDTPAETFVDDTDIAETIPETVIEVLDNISPPLQTEEVFTELEQYVPKSPGSAGTIALTFDDGPGKYTERLLDILKEYDAKATFFVVGNRASYQKDKLKRMVDEGHEVGNHTYNHISLKELEEQEIIDQILTTKNLIQEATGIESKLIRAPYGDLSPTIKAIGQEQNVSFIHWSLDTFDWKTRDAQSVYDELMSRVTDGDIILLHDIHESTIDAMEMVIPELANNGYKLVTVSELLTETRDYIYPGTVYSKK